MNAVRVGFALVLYSLGSVPASAVSHEQTEKRGTIVATLQLDKTDLPLSGHLQLTLTIEGPTPLEVELPTLLSSPQELWLTQAMGKPETTSLPKQRQRWRQGFRLEPLASKQVPLPIAPLRVRAGTSGAWQEVTWKPVTIEVTTSVEEPSVKALRDITPIEQVPPVEQLPYALIVAIAATALFLGMVVRGLRRRQPLSQPESSPSERALRELDRIETLELPTERESERFHVLICDVLRQYVERRFGLPATGQTTGEFLDGLRRSSVLAAHQQDALREFLRQCDLAKFAQAEFSPFECKALARMARDFILQTTPTPANGQLIARD